jgi:ribose 5-phosphate isomerase B
MNLSGVQVQFINNIFSMKLAIGSDHAGFEYKEKLKQQLGEQHEIKDFGTYSLDSADYPDFAHPVSEAVEKNEFTLGILVCGSANGVAITANKHQGIRAAICWNEELASLARRHNNANVLCLPARFIDFGVAEKVVDKFIQTDFEGGRHATRVNKITC